MLDATPKTILFSGHDFRFLRPFIDWCQSSPRWTVLLDEHQGHEITDPKRCRDLLPSADVIFCEWCLGNAVWYSQHKSPRQLLLVRLHEQEMRLQFLDRICWEKVDALILICPHNLDLIRKRYPFLRDKTHLIYNAIDSASLDQPKLPGAEFNLGLMGICPMRKAPHLAVEILAQLKSCDSRYTLFVKGKSPRDYDWLWRRPEERAYYEKFFADVESCSFANSVVFESYGYDVPVWLSKIGFILSTSDFEGSHQSVAEGMASGAVPIIRNWAGAEALYPQKYVVGSVEEAVRTVQKWRTPALYEAEVEFCRSYAKARFDHALICKKIEALIDLLWQPAGVGVMSTELVARPHVSHDLSLTVPPRPECEPRARSHRNGAPPILMLCYLPPGSCGGYRIRIEQEIKTLISQRVRIHMACLHPEDADPMALRSHQAELAALGCDVSLVPITGFFDIDLNSLKIRTTLDALQHITDASGLNIVHAEALYCARVGLLLKERRPGLRLVFDCHGTTPEEERVSGAHRARIAMMRDWERRVVAAANLNVFVSEAMKDFYHGQYGLSGAATAIVPCCVADEQFADKNSASFLPGLPLNRPIIAYLGTMAAWQCGEEMIRLFAQLYQRDCQLFFLLLVPHSDHARTHDLMAKAGLPQASVLLTELPHDHVVSALQHAHAGVLLRRADPVNRVSSPTKFAEYLAAGVPVIMTDGIGDFSHMAARQGVGLVIDAAVLERGAYPSADLARIEQFVRDSFQCHHRIASRCSRTAHEHLHWHRAAARLVAGYRALNGGNGASRQGSERLGIREWTPADLIQSATCADMEAARRGPHFQSATAPGSK
jgi:glycosyltransferase involved in cell wall biosynthesis